MIGICYFFRLGPSFFASVSESCTLVDDFSIHLIKVKIMGCNQKQFDDYLFSLILLLFEYRLVIVCCYVDERS